MLFILPFLPIAFIIFSLFLFKDILKASFATYLLILFLSFYYSVFPEKILEAHLNSALSAFKIFLLIFSLLLIFNFLEKEKVLSHFKKKDLKTFITVGVFFTILIEGLVGFGTPGMIATRTLIDLNFNPLHSAIISLQSDFTSHFGAFATPINVVKNFYPSLDFVKYVGLITSVLLLFPIIFSSFILKERIGFDIIISYLLFSISAIFISFYFTSYFYLILVISSTLSLIFLFLENRKLLKEFLKFVSPFFLGIFLYLILNQFTQIVTNFFGIGIIFLLIALILYNSKIDKENLEKPFKNSIKLFLIIFFLSYVALFYSISKYNSKNFPSLVEIISNVLKFSDSYFLILSPIIGILGAFIFGSATVSNLTFFNIQKEIALSLNLDVDKVLALQCIGAGIGNMISLYNISAIVALSEKLKNKEIEIIKVNSLFAAIFTIISYLLILFL